MCVRWRSREERRRYVSSFHYNEFGHANSHDLSFIVLVPLFIRKAIAIHPATYSSPTIPHPFFPPSLPFSPFYSTLFLPQPKLRCSICIYHQPIVIVNYNYYKRLHEIINSDKMSEKKTITHGCVLLCDDDLPSYRRRCLHTLDDVSRSRDKSRNYITCGLHRESF